MAGLLDMISKQTLFITVAASLAGCAGGSLDQQMPGGVSEQLFRASVSPFAASQTPKHVSAATFVEGKLAVESIVSVFGVGLADATIAAPVPLPTELGGTRVRILDQKGEQHFAPLFFVSPGQINYLIPVGTAPGNATISVVQKNGSEQTAMVKIAPAAPGIFTANATGHDAPSAYALRIGANGAQNYQPVAKYDNASKQYIPTVIEPANEDEKLFLVLFGTGVRHRTPYGKVAAKFTRPNFAQTVYASYAGRQGVYDGLDQINIPITQDFTGEINLAMEIDGVTSNAVKVRFRDGLPNLPARLGFAAAVDYCDGRTTDSITTGDFNGDGQLDFAAASANAYEISVHLNTGTGFTRTNYHLPSYGAGYRFVTGDLNEDGALDLVNSGNAGKLIVMYGKGDGTFGEVFYYDIRFSDVALADMNDDGHLDIVGIDNDLVIGFGSGKNPPNAIGKVVRYPVSHIGSGSLRIADLNNDGELDVAIGQYQQGTPGLVVMLGKGDEKFDEPAYYNAGSTFHDFAIADFNSDGLPDFALTPNGSDVYLRLLLNKGAGTFGNASDLTGTTLRTPQAADFNGDGLADLLMITERNKISFAVLSGKGDGTFKAPVEWKVASPTDSSAYFNSAIGDLNGDGMDDVLLGDKGCFVVTNQSVRPSES